MERQAIPGGVLDCCKTLRRAGHAAFLVGGCVRDLALGRVPHDYDLATDARPEQVAALFPRTIPTGIQHGTVTVLTADGPVEVTTFRGDGDYTDGRRPASVTFCGNLTDDLARRDFTINAMALGEDGTLADPWGGMADLRAGIVRCVGDPAQRFREDGLRMLRAVRFTAQLGFSLECDTAAALRACAGGAARLSAERVRAELEQILLSAHPGRAEDLLRWGLLRRFLPEIEPPDLSDLAGCRAAALPRWAVFCKRTGFPIRALRVEARLCRAVEIAVDAERPGTPAAWRRFLAGQGPAAAEALSAIWGLEEALAAVLHDPWRLGQLALSGGELQSLGLRGPEIGAAQRRLLSHVLEHPEDNTREKLRTLLDGVPRCPV